eukprot:g1538.t1
MTLFLIAANVLSLLTSASIASGHQIESSERLEGSWSGTTTIMGNIGIANLTFTDKRVDVMLQGEKTFKKIHCKNVPYTFDYDKLASDGSCEIAFTRTNCLKNKAKKYNADLDSLNFNGTHIHTVVKYFGVLSFDMFLGKDLGESS